MLVTITDLFGGETRVVSGRVPKKELLNYRKATGDFNCSNCIHSYMVKGNTKKYRKCVIIGESSSSATDVSNRCVCGRHKKADDKA